MRPSQRFKDRKYSWPLGMGISNWDASKNLGNSILSFFVSAAPRSLISAFLQNCFFILSQPFLLLWAHGGKWLPRVALLVCSLLSSPGPQLCLAQSVHSSSQQKLPRTSKMSQGLILGKGSDWSSQLRRPFFIQSAMAKGRV